jgi:uncharacterized lipoprotein YddW (UPF0748 family)
MKSHCAFLPVVFLLSIVAGSFAQSSTPELRAMWATRFDWPSGDRATIQARIDSIMQDLADHGFNAVFFQIRGQADVFYPSPYEPWSPLINGGVDPGWDPVAYAINAAHSHGIEFHAYINTHTCWLGKQPPTNTSHLYYQHCNAADPDHRDWLIHDSAGNPVPLGEEYVWLAPGVPAYQAYIRQQVLYVVQNYNVDGIHFDRIRTSGSSYSHDPISEARRGNAWSNPDGLNFDQWTADQITRNVRDMYAAIADLKPNLRISAAVMSYSSTSAISEHQDTLAWMQTGGLDTAVPMAYFSGGAGTTWDTELQRWVANASGRHVVMGHNTNEGIPMLLEQVALTRARGAHGNGAYTWGTFPTAFWDEYLTSVYQMPAAPPSMPWKTATGIISGFVRRSGGTPVVDAHVTRTGATTYTGLSTGDGFYSLLLVPPGTYTITASHPNHGSATASVTVTVGNVAHADLTLPLNLPPILAEVSPNPGSALTDTLYTQTLTFTQGLADGCTILQGPRGAKVNAGGLVTWQPVLADAGTTVTFKVRATNSAGTDEVTWRVAVSAAPACVPLRLADFETYAVGTRVMFKDPRGSNTSGNLATTPNVARVTAAVAYGGTHAYELQWQFLDASPGRWLRLTTYNSSVLPNPTIDLRRPIRVRLRLDNGSLRLCVGVRESGTDAALGADGGTSGSIEWIGATSKISDAPQGVLVRPQPGVWQTFVFNPLTDPIQTYTGEGVVASSNNKGTLEHLAFTIVDTAGPITVYLDDVDQLCRTEPYGDYNRDGWVDLIDLGRFTPCLLGPTLDQLDPACAGVDSDGDLDVDQEDFGRLQRCLDTAGPQANLQCGD